MAVRPQPFVLLSEGSPIDGAMLYRYRQGHSEIRMLLIRSSWLLDPGPQREAARACLATAIEAARRDGLLIVLPREVVGSGFLVLPGHTTY